MKRKLMAVVLCAAMVLGVASCGSKEETSSLSSKEEYAAAVQKIEKAEGMDSKMKTKIKISTKNMNMNVSIGGDVKVVKKSADDVQMLMEMNTDMFGQPVAMNYYYTDNKYYMDIAGQKIMCKMSMEKAWEKITSSYDMSNVDVKLIKDVKVEDEDGNRVFTYTLDSGKMNEYMEKSLKLLTSLIADMDKNNVSIKEFKGKMVVNKDGNPLEQITRFNMGIKTKEQNLTIKVEATMKYNKIGKDVTIKFPSFDGYEEVEEKLMNEMQ